MSDRRQNEAPSARDAIGGNAVDRHEERGRRFVPSRPRLLDLFCGAGGAAMGYHRAGFDVVGVDIASMPRYPFQFIQADAMDVLADREDMLGWWDTFDAIHASPPCQHYSAATADSSLHPDLYEAVRDHLEAIGLPWVLENVTGAPYRSGVVICGSHFGMRIRRHRNFETSFPMLVQSCQHGPEAPLSVTGTGYGGKQAGHNGTKPRDVAEAREVMGIDWMTIRELSEAIPPAYTEHIGGYLMRALTAVAA